MIGLNCINTHSADFKKLVSTSKHNPLKLSALASKWQKQHNTDRIPTSKEIDDFIYIDYKASESLNYNGEYTAETRRHINKLLTYCGFAVMDSLKTTTYKDFKDSDDIKSNILDQLYYLLEDLAESEESTEEQVRLAVKIQEDLEQPNSKAWHHFVNYFSSIYKMSIVDMEAFIEDNGFEEIPQLFDDKAQLKINRTDNVATKVKFLLSSVIEGTNDLTGLPEVVDFDVLLNRLINAHINDRTKEDFLDTIRYVASVEYPGLVDLLTVIEEDENALNAYITSLNFDLAHVYNIVTSDVNDLHAFDVLDQNRSSFVATVTYDAWLDNISTNLKAGKIVNAKYNDKFLKMITKHGKAALRNSWNVDTNDFVSPSYDTGIEFGNYVQDIKHLNQLSALLREVGIEFTDKILKNVYKYYRTYRNNYEFMTEILKPIKYILLDIYTNESLNPNAKDYSYAKYTTQAGSLMMLAERTARYSSMRTQLDYLDVNNNTNYTPIYQSYGSRLFTGINDANTIHDRFFKFTKDVKFQYSNLLWGGMGVFVPDIKNGVKTVADIQYRGVNLENVRKFEFKFFNGIKSLSDNIGIDYTESMNSNWDLIKFLSHLDHRYMIPSSDAGRISTLRLDLGIRVDPESNDITIKDGKVVAVNMNNQNTQLVYNTILQELTEMRKFTNILFDVDELGELTVKDDKTLLARTHPIKHRRGNKFLENGKPTGEVFKFSNLTYRTTENGKSVVHRLNDLLSDNTHLTESKISDHTREQIEKFIEKAMIHNMNEQIAQFDSLYPILKNYTREIRRKYLNLNDKKSDLVKNLKFNKREDYDRHIAEFYLADYIAQVEIANFINGNINEYGNQINYNKRASQSIKNGQTTLDGGSCKVLHSNDAVFPTKFKSLLNGINKDLADKFEDVNIADGFSIITDEEFKKRSIAWGRYDTYEELLKDLNDPNTPFDATKYSQFVESQKYFYYSRELDYTLDKDNPEMLSRQYKDSTLVLTKRMINNTQFQELYDFMKRNNIGQLSFSSAAKVGNINPVTLFDENGNFIGNEDIEFDYSDHVRDLYYKDLVVQLDIPSHNKDSKNKIGVQLEKLILNNVKDTTEYIVDDKKLTGAELKKHYHGLIAANIKESALDLLYEFGALDENNNIKYNDLGLIDISKEVLIKYLKKYVKENEHSKLLNDILATHTSDAETNLPIYNGLTAEKFTSIVLSTVSNRVIHQRINGTHDALIPEICTNPSDLSYLSPDKIDEYRDVPKGIQWASEMYDQIKDPNHSRKDFTLQINTSYDENGNKIQVAEVVMSPYYSKFYEDGEIIDINRITEDARTGFGIRIPTEGKQSMLYFKVVGFFNTGASQTMFPRDFVNKTGWDFDIDTVYTSLKTVELNENNEYDTIQYLDENTDIRDRYNIYIQHLRTAKKIRLEYYDLFKNLSKSLISAKGYTLKNLLKELNVESKENLIDILDSLRAGYIRRNELSRLIEYLDESHETEDKELKSELSRELKELNDDIKNIETALKHDAISIRRLMRDNDKKLNKDYITQYKELQHGLQEELEAQISIEDFAKLSIEEQNIRNARNNQLINIYGSVVSNKEHIDEYYNPNDTVNIEAGSRYINDLWNYDIDGINMNNSFDANIFRNLNMAVRKLKGNSVAWDGIMAIFSQVGVKLPYMVFQVNKSDIFETDINKLKKIFKGVKDLGDRWELTTANIGVNESGEFTDIDGNKITNQAIEVTTNILDAVKVIMGFNINEHTLSVFKLLVNTPMSVNFEGNSNHFIIPYLVTHQPIIVEMVKKFTLDKLYDTNSNMYSTMKDLETEYTIKLYNSIKDEVLKFINIEDGKLTKSISTKFNKAVRTKSLPYFKKEERDIFESALHDYCYSKYKATLLDNSIPTIQLMEENIKQFRGTNSSPNRSEGENAFQQLRMLRIFRNLNDTAGSVVKSISTLNSDKLGTGSSFSVNRTLDNNLVSMAVDKAKLNTLGIIDDYLPNTVNNILDAVGSAKDKLTAISESIIGRPVTSFTDEDRKYVRTVFSKLGVFKDKNDDNLIYAIYPSLFGEDISNSIYPTLQSYYKYGNELAMYSFTQFFPHESDTLFKFKSEILYNQKLLNDPYLNKLVNSYINTKFTNDISFFKYTDNKALLEKIKNEKYGGNPDYILARIKNKVYSLSKGIDQFLDPALDTYINVNNPSDEDLEKFSLLNLHDRLLLLKTSNTIKEITSKKAYQGNHILSNLLIADQKGLSGRKLFTYRIKGGLDSEFVSDSILNMLTEQSSTNKNINIMLRDVIGDMIRNHYWLSGISFSNNITKYLDISLLHNKNNQARVDLLNMNEYSEKLSVLEDEQEVLLNLTDLKSAFYKSHWNNSKLVPIVTNRKNPSKYYPNFSFLYRAKHIDDLKQPVHHILHEEINKLSRQPVFDNADYIIKKVNNKKILYKRYYSANSNTTVYYYPVNKTMQHEINDSIMIDNYEFTDNVQIYTEDTYQKIIDNEAAHEPSEGTYKLQYEETYGSLDTIGLIGTQVEKNLNQPTSKETLKFKSSVSNYLAPSHVLTNPIVDKYGFKYYTLNAYIGAMMTSDKVYRYLFTGQNITDSIVKDALRKIKKRENWSELKPQVIEEGIIQKYLNNNDLAKKLLKTGDAKLEYISKNTELGISAETNEGSNLVGKATETVRTIIQKQINFARSGEATHAVNMDNYGIKKYNNSIKGTDKSKFKESNSLNSNNLEFNSNIKRVDNIAQLYNINIHGFFNKHVEYDKLKSELKKLGFGLKQSSNKQSYYITLNGRKYTPPVCHRKYSESLNTNIPNRENTTEFTGNKFEFIKSLKDKFGASIYIGNTDDIYGKVLNYDKHLQLNPDLSDEAIANSIVKFMDEHSPSINFVILGSKLEETDYDQDELNARVSNILKLVLSSTPRIPRLHTLNSDGYNEALVNNRNNNLVYNYKQDKDTYEMDDNPKYAVHSEKYLLDDNTLQDKTYINNQINLIVNNIKDLLNYESLYHTSELRYKNQLLALQSQVVDSGDFVKLARRDIDTIILALQSQSKVLTPMVEHINGIHKALMKIDFSTFDTYSIEERNRIAKKIRQFNHLVKRFDFIDELDYVADDRIINKDKLKVINDKIKEFKDLKESINSKIKKAEGFTHNLLHALFYMHSTNPEFKNQFQRTLRALDEEGKFNKSVYDDDNITPEEIYNQMKQLLTENIAMSSATLAMDSVFNTGLPLVDTILKTYITLRSDKNKKVNELTDKLNKILKDYYGTGVDISLFGDHKSLENGFLKFVNLDNGRFKDKYDWAKFNQAQRDMYNEYQRLQNLAQLSKILLDKEKRLNKPNKDNITKYTNEFNSAVAKSKKIVKNWYKENTIQKGSQVKLSAEESKKLKHILDTRSKEEREKYIRYNNYKQVFGANDTLVYIKLIPTDEYIDPSYKLLTEKDLKFLNEYKGLIKEITDMFPQLIIGDDFIPLSRKQGLNQAVKQTLGIKRKTNKLAEHSLDGEILILDDVPMTQNRKYHSLITYDAQVNMTNKEYEEHVLKQVNSRYKYEKFKSIQEIEDYNAAQKQKNKDYISRQRNYNPLYLMSQFIYSTMEYKHVNDFQNVFQLLLQELSKNTYAELQTGNKANRILNKISTKLTGKNTYKTVNGRNTTAYKRIVDSVHSFNNLSNIHTLGDQILNVSKSVTSIIYMAANLTGAIKNVMTGYQNILMEGAASQYITRKDLKDATEAYMKSLTNILGDFGKEYSTDLTSAIIKEAHDLLDLRDSAEQTVSSKNTEARVFMALNNTLYAGNNGTEHFMQYTMLLAMMRSHRIINGRTVSFEQFQRNIREEVLLDVLNFLQTEEYNKFKDKALERKSNHTKMYDYVGEWLNNDQNVPFSVRQAFNKKLKEKLKNLKAQYEQYETVYEQFELKDGRAVLKKDAKITNERYELFKKKVYDVNASLHGIYNKLDKMALRNKAIWDVAFQFRSWAKPNWDRYFGKRFWKAQYNEGLETYQKGIFSSLFGTFLYTPFKLSKKYGEKQEQLDFYISVIKNYMHFFAHAATYYNIMTPIDRANVNRAAVNFLHIIGTTIVLQLLGSLAGGGDDKEAIDSKGYAAAIYILNSYHSEISQFLPIYGQYAFYSRTKENPLAAQRVMLELYKLTKELILAPFGGDRAMYQQGMYKGKSKLGVAVSKNIPVYRQIYKWENMELYTGWYKMYNPINVFGLEK